MNDLSTIILSCMIRFQIIFCPISALPFPSISAIYQYSNIIISYQITFSDLNTIKISIVRNFQKKSGNVSVNTSSSCAHFSVFLLTFIQFFTSFFLVLYLKVVLRFIYCMVLRVVWRQGTSFVHLPVNPTTTSIYITVCYVSMTVSLSHRLRQQHDNSTSVCPVSSLSCPYPCLCHCLCLCLS